MPAHKKRVFIKGYRKLKKASDHEPDIWLRMCVLKFTLRIALRSLFNESTRIYVYTVSSPARGGERRDRVAAALNSSDEDDGPPLQTRHLHELIRKNHEVYNVFMTRRLPRILREYRVWSAGRPFES